MLVSAAPRFTSAELISGVSRDFHFRVYEYTHRYCIYHDIDYGRAISLLLFVICGYPVAGSVYSHHTRVRCSNRYSSPSERVAVSAACSSILVSSGNPAPYRALTSIIKTTFPLNVPSNRHIGRHGDLSNHKPTPRTNPLPEAATRTPKQVSEECLVLLGSILVGRIVTLSSPGEE